MAKTKEIQFRDIPGEIADLVAMQFMLDETPIIVWHDPGALLYVVLTGVRLVTADMSSKHVTSIYLADVTGVAFQYKYGHYYLYQYGSKVVSLSLYDDDLRLKVGHALYQALNAAKVKRV